MELLSPAGNITAAYSAFKGGADAIYLGGKLFSARASADNFTNDEIKEIVFFAHSIGKKVYVTVNTLLYQDEFFQAVDFCKFLYSINVDGIIIQDLGLAHYLHKTLPDLPLNASTQLNCHNLAQAKALIKIGFKRIVLAREVNLETAKKIKDLGVEVEVFGHGALCVSYSGNCLLSSFVGDRSGNRGKCAQPCRLRYDLLEDGQEIDHSIFSISTKDLMTLDFLDKFIDAGIDSLKIEGRLKSNEYIYAVSKAYRHAIDAAYENIQNKQTSGDKQDLIKIFNRQFTKGYVLNESPFSLLNTIASSHQGEEIGYIISTSKNRVAIKLNSNVHRLDGIRFESKEQFGLSIEKMFLNKDPVEEAHKGDIIELAGIENANRLRDLKVIRTKDFLVNEKINNELKCKLKVNASASFKAYVNKPIELTVSFNNESVTCKGFVAQVAEGNGTQQDRVIEQLNKTGDYPYIFNNIDVDMEKCFIPISAINELRNNALEQLKNKLCKTNEINEIDYKNITNNKVFASETIIITENSYQKQLAEENGFTVYSKEDSNHIIEDRVTSKTEFNADREIVNFVIEHQGNNYLVASPYCNITNSYALDCYYSLGFDECMLSLELDYISINSLIRDYENRHGKLPIVGLLVYGKPDVMIMRSCPIGTHYNNKTIHCNRCHYHAYHLVDRIGEKYRLLGDSNCNIRILNNFPIFLFDRLEEISRMGIQKTYIQFTDENIEKVTEVIDHYQNKDTVFSRTKHTRGHYNKRAL